MARVVPVLLAAVQIACVPLPTLVQPGLRFEVADEDGVAVEGARIQLAQYSISLSSFDAIRSEQTDGRGVASFPKQRQLQFFFLAADGGVLYSWSWCVEKAGFEPVMLNDLRSNGYAAQQKVALRRSAGSAGCRWEKGPYRFVAGGA